jgi:hypothetical protein
LLLGLPMRTPLAEELAAAAAVWLPDIMGWLAVPGLAEPGLFGWMLPLTAVVFLWLCTLLLLLVLLLLPEKPVK